MQNRYRVPQSLANIEMLNLHAGTYMHKELGNNLLPGIMKFDPWKYGCVGNGRVQQSLDITDGAIGTCRVITYHLDWIHEAVHVEERVKYHAVINDHIETATLHTGTLAWSREITYCLNSSS